MSALDEMFSPQVGRRVVGLGAVALGLVGLVWGDYATVWGPGPVAASLPHALGYVVSCAPLVAGLALEWRRTARRGASALTGLYAVAVLFIDLPRAVAHPSIFANWYAVAEPLALAAGALLAYASCPASDPRATAHLTRLGRQIFGLCLCCFAVAHLVYRDYTAALVPGWLPPGRDFWTYATAGGHFAAALAMLFGRQMRVAAMLLTGMFIVFGLLVHAPSVYLVPHSHANWAENAINLALIGTAWMSASSARGRAPRASSGRGGG